MTLPLVLSVVESAAHPNFLALYQSLGLEVVTLDSQRKTIAALKRHTPQYVVAEFFYTFNTYYQATTLSNLDVLLHSLVKYAPQAKVIVLVNKDQRTHVDRLNTILPLHGILTYPLDVCALESLLQS